MYILLYVCIHCLPDEVITEHIVTPLGNGLILSPKSLPSGSIQEESIQLVFSNKNQILFSYF